MAGDPGLQRTGQQLGLSKADLALPDDQLQAKINDALNKTGINTQATQAPSTGMATPQSFISDEMSMAVATGKQNVLTGWTLPSNMSPHDFFQTVSWAEQWAATAGWKYFPTPQQLIYIAQHGPNDPQGMDQTRANSIFSAYAGITNSMPWTALGLTNTAYNERQRQLQDQVDALVGPGNYSNPTILQQAMQGNWTPSQFLQYVKQDTGFQQQFGYVSWGYDYNTWNTYKAQNQQQVLERFGNTSDASYLQTLSNPAQQFKAQGGAISPARPSGLEPPAQSAPTVPGQSEVR